MPLAIPFALFGWPILTLLMFTLLKPRQAVVVSILAGWLILPNFGYPVPIIRNFDKTTGTVAGALIGALLFDSHRVFSYRPSKLDLLMLAWCTCPAFSSLSNDLGIYDGLAESMTSVMLYGIPYMIGRWYCSTMADARAFLMALFISGVALLPFCLLEMTKGPFIHARMYGFYPHNYWEQLKAGGWRPSVNFMHGLWLCGFLAYAGVAGACLCLGRAMAPKYLKRARLMAIAVGAVLLNCRSQSAMVIYAAGGAIALARQFRRVLLILLIAVPPVYVTLRTSGLWSGDDLVSAARETFGGRPAGSLNTRLDLENRIIGRAWMQPVFGWGGYGRSVDIETEDRRGTWTEALWTKTLGQNGLYGIVTWLASSLVPACILVTKLKKGAKMAPQDGIILGVALVATMHTIYSLMVLDFSPVNPLFTGVAASLASNLGRVPKPITDMVARPIQPPIAPNVATR